VWAKLDAGTPGELVKHYRLWNYVAISRICYKIAEAFPNVTYTAAEPGANHNPMWAIPADCAFPCATENEINGRDAANLIEGGVTLVCEGANMPCTPEAMEIFLDHQLLYAPGKAANAGGVAVSGLEMAQNSMRLRWPRAEVDQRLRHIMHAIHRTCLDAAAAYDMAGNYVAGANIAGFTTVVEAMLDQGLV